MGQKPPARTLYHVGCPCGGVFSMDARGFGRPVVCKRCGGSFTIGWGKDPRTQKSSPIAVALAKKSGPTPLQVACSCGYRRAVTASEAAGHNRCPGCGKAMIVIKPPSPKTQIAGNLVSLSKPPPAPTAPPASSGGSEPRLIRITLGTQTVDCVCGEKIFVRSEQQLISCPGCNRKIRVEVKDKSSASFPRVVPGGRTPTPPPGFTCECGQALEVSKALDSKGTVCTGCGRSITMEKVRGPQTKHTIIRPRFGPKGGPPPAPSAPAPKASDGFLEMPPVEFSEEEAPAPVARQDTRAQPVFCPCGEALMVGVESVGRNIQCPTCMILIAVDQIRDSGSGNFVLRVRAIGKMDQDTWSLNDFS